MAWFFLPVLIAPTMLTTLISSRPGWLAWSAYDDVLSPGASPGQGSKYLKEVGRIEMTIKLDELVAMFERAAQNDDIPDAAILREYTILL